MTNFQTRLELTIRGREFVLLADLVYQGNQQTFRVPAGFQTDLASIPWFLEWLMPRVSEKHAKAAIVHDFFYSNHHVTRKDADRIFFRIMVEDGEQIWRALLMRWGVRLFGWWAWRL